MKYYTLLLLLCCCCLSTIYAQNYVGIKVEGEQNYCVGSNNGISIATNVETNLETYNSDWYGYDYVDVTVAIDNAQRGDILWYNNRNRGAQFSQQLTYITNDKASFKKKFSAFINGIKFKTTSNSSGSRKIKIEVNHKSYLKATNHFYEYGEDEDIHWSAAKKRSEENWIYTNETNNRFSSYLATITSQDENDFVKGIAYGEVWLGGRNVDEKNRVWRWVTGPEGIENNGGGTIFWRKKGGCSLYCSNWRRRNGASSEGYYLTTDYGWWRARNYDGTDWNISGYVVEYGGMPGDPEIKMQATVTINVVSKPQPKGIYYSE